MAKYPAYDESAKVWRPVGASIVVLVLSLTCLPLLAAPVDLRGNLLVNGSFEDTEDPLKGWKYVYDLPGEDFYFENHKNVSVIPVMGTKRGVLRLYGTRKTFWGSGHGTKVDSKPVPYEQGYRYKLSLMIRSVGDNNSKGGPGCRIQVEGYQWMPGIKPHDNPDFHELRKVYRSELLFPWPNAGKYTSWTKGSGFFPGKDLSKEAERHLDRVDFMSVHIIAIDGWDGALLVDDVVLTKVERFAL